MQIDGFWPPRSQFLDRMRCGRWLAGAVIALGLAAALTGCGGGDASEQVAASPGVATIGAAGGTVTDAAGAQVVFPKGALRADITVRIAKDSTGAPPLPTAATPAGAVYMITPHGEAFAVHAEVSIPVEITDIADNQQLLLVTAEPGDTQWRVLSGASYARGLLRAPVMHFSYFQAIILTDVYMPSLVTTMEVNRAASNNVGGAGIGRFSPDFEFTQDSGLQYSYATLRAKFTFPPLPLASRLGLTSLPPQRPCLPSSYAHTGAAWRFLRNGVQTAAEVTHYPLRQVADSEYPRYDNEITFWGYSGNLLFFGDEVPGFGAVHVYGQDTPRRGAFAPADSTDVWALPPAGNIADNDQLMWAGFVLFNGEQHNGRMRIDVTVATDCNLLIEAVPISFQLNLASRTNTWKPYQGVFGRGSPINAPNGGTAVLPFVEETNGTTASIAWEYSHDLVNWEKLPVPAQYIRDDGPNNYWEDYYANGHSYSIVIPNVQPSQAGWYRAWACSTSICVSKAPVQLVVLTERPTVTSQPVPQVVLVGQTASFSVNTTYFSDLPGILSPGVPDVTVQWQKRPLVEAAFGIGTWTNIDGATLRWYTTPPTTLNDTATLYRAVLSTVLGSTASDAALLTVLEQLAPPLVESQPGNLNVMVGGSAMFAATVSGTAPLSYQWRRNGANLIGANSAILTLANVSGLDAGRYDLVVTNRAGSVTSEPAVLVVTQGTPVALPPTIAASPASITVAEGNAANFAVSVNGTGPYTYLWMKNGVQAPIPGGDAPSFSIASVSTADAGTYSVRVTNDVGTVVSAAATLTVGAGAATPVAPTISTQPATLVVMPGSAATLAIAASGSGPLVYQWSRNGMPVNGATGAVLHLSSVSMLDAGTYMVAVSNSAGSVGSSAAQLILVGAPAITAQPASVSVVDGGAATFAVTASGDALRYQWTRNQVAIAGATAASHTTPALTLADSGAVYGVIVYNGASLVFSQGAVLSVSPAVIAPAVTLQPLDTTVADGAPANLDVAFGGTPPFSVQPQRFSSGAWVNFSSAVAISDNNMVRFSTGNLSAAGGPYVFRYVASNAAGSAATNAVTVTVTAAPILTATTLASVAASGGAPNNWSTTPSLSADGLLVAFRSDGTNLVPGTTVFGHAYLRNLATNTTTLINARPDGTESARGVSGAVKLSANGRYAVFTSLANDLVPNDTNVAADVFLRDLATGTTTRLNVLPNGAQDDVSGNSVGQPVDISADGRWVLMYSGVNLAGDGAALPNGYGVFLRDTVNGTTRALPDITTNAWSISASGRFIATVSGTASVNVLQVYDVQTGALSTVYSVDSTVFPDGIGGKPSISDDGQVIAFGLRSSTLPGYETYNQIAVYDRGAAPGFELQLQSATNGAVAGNSHSSNPVLSGDGRYVLFSTNAPNLSGDPAATVRPYLIVRDRQTGTAAVASRRVDGLGVAVGNYGHALSRDGAALAFVADMNTMFTPGQPGEYQVFVAPRP